MLVILLARLHDICLLVRVVDFDRQNLTTAEIMARNKTDAENAKEKEGYADAAGALIAAAATTLLKASSPSTSQDIGPAICRGASLGASAFGAAKVVDERREGGGGRGGR